MSAREDAVAVGKWVAVMNAPYDVIAAQERVVGELDTLRAARREDNAILLDIATALRETAEQWPTPNRYSEMADAILADLAAGSRVEEDESVREQSIQTEGKTA